eukprot:6824129-Prymnesium_polylepis.1
MASSQQLPLLRVPAVAQWAAAGTGTDGNGQATDAVAAHAAASATFYVSTSDARAYLSSGTRTAFNNAAVNVNLARARRALQDLELARSAAGPALVKA